MVFAESFVSRWESTRYKYGSRIRCACPVPWLPGRLYLHRRREALGKATHISKFCRVFAIKSRFVHRRDIAARDRRVAIECTPSTKVRENKYWMRKERKGRSPFAQGRGRIRAWITDHRKQRRNVDTQKVNRGRKKREIAPFYYYIIEKSAVLLFNQSLMRAWDARARASGFLLPLEIGCAVN